jgi:hypothetical protein
MIETDFFILNQEQYDEFNADAQELGITLDYLLLEFCDIEGPYITAD